MLWGTDWENERYDMSEFKYMQIIRLMQTINPIITVISIIIAIIAINTNNNRLSNQLIEVMSQQEISIRDSLSKELNKARAERKTHEAKVDSLTKIVNKSDSTIKHQITIFRYETFKNLKDYRDSTNSELLNRLRTR